MAYLAYFLGDYEQARAAGEEGLAINDETGDREGRARILVPLLLAAFELGDDRCHLRLSGDLLNLARDLGDQENVARALTQLGMGALHAGNFRQAFALFTEALELALRLENRATTALTLAMRGDVFRQDGDLARAAAAYRDSLAIYVDYNYVRPMVLGLERLASLACCHAQWQRAARLYAAAAVRRAELGINVAPSNRDSMDADIAAIRVGLGDEPFQAVWGSGQAMSFVDVIASALEADPAPAAARPSTPGKLSPRETDVLRLIAAGQSNKQIAAELSLSVHTIERHITNLYAKIDARGRGDATAWALRHGLA
jgi:DNA-binding CsgD family transcriptional regulator